jgi:EmrB/QacA subfamily drug resistance transporter
MVVLDITIVNVALPTIGDGLGFAPADLQWVVTAYVLFTGGLLLLGGKAADLIGRRPVFLAGLAVFTAASLVSGLAQSPAMLVAARAAQGLGAAMLTPAALSIVTTSYSGRQRTVALSAWAAIGSAGAALGVVLGGILVSWLSWRWVFLVNVPIGAVAGVVALRLLPRAPAARARLDLPGAASLVGGLGVLLYALDGAPEHGWGSARTLVLLALATALLAAFAAVERVAGDPVLPPRTWRRVPVVSSAVVMLGATGILVATFFLNSLYLQNVLGDSALAAGLKFLPLVLAIGAAAHAASHLLAQVGSRAVAVAGLALAAAGALLLALAPAHAGYLADLLPGLLAIGFGVGLAFPAASVTAMSDVPHDEAGLISGVMSTAHELGAALGTAVLSAVASAGATFAGGYGDAFAAAAVAAVVLAVVALVAVPATRPAPGQRVAVH